MNLKKKIFGLGAVAALSLSMMSGAMAADTSVTLNDGQPCHAAISEGSIDFGTWEWNGTKYVNKERASGRILVDVTNSKWAIKKCDVQLSVSDLSPRQAGQETPANVIPGASVSLTGATGRTYSGVPQNTTLRVGATLNADLATFAPDNYFGTITVATVNAGR